MRTLLFADLHARRPWMDWISAHLVCSASPATCLICSQPKRPRRQGVRPDPHVRNARDHTPLGYAQVAPCVPTCGRGDYASNKSTPELMPLRGSVFNFHLLRHAYSRPAPKPPTSRTRTTRASRPEATRTQRKMSAPDRSPHSLGREPPARPERDKGRPHAVRPGGQGLV